MKAQLGAWDPFRCTGPWSARRAQVIVFLELQGQSGRS